MRLCLLFLPALGAAHSWVEWLSVVNDAGIPVGVPGFPRGHVPRTTPEFHDGMMTYVLPRPGKTLIEDAHICASAQRRLNTTAESPALQAAPGSTIVLRYQENGHVTLERDPAKPSPGQVYVYGTTSPSESDSILQIHHFWNSDGSGGDGRGRLLGIFNFDDGRCFQVNDGPISKYRQSRYGHAPDPLQGNDLWCNNIVRLPDNLHGGDLLTLYWVWDWPNNPGRPDEQLVFYTTCIDIYIVDCL